jgi:hypothetical protein
MRFLGIIGLGLIYINYSLIKFALLNYK